MYFSLVLGLILWLVVAWTRSSNEESILNSCSESLPYIGSRSRLFGKLRASLKSFSSLRELLRTGWIQFGQLGKPFTMTDMSGRPFVMLPSEYTKWYSRLPESVVSGWSYRQERNGRAYIPVQTGSKTILDFFHRVVYDGAGLQIHQFHHLMAAEIIGSIEHLLGTSEEWCDVSLQEFTEVVVTQVTVKTFFGARLYNNKSFRHSLHRFVLLMSIAAFLPGQLIFPLRPLLGYSLTIPIWFYRRLAMRYLSDEITRKRAEPNIQSNREQHEPSDFVDFYLRVLSLRNSASKSKHAEFDVAEQLMILAIPSLTTSSILAGTFLDILSAPTQWNVYEAIQKEARSVAPSPEALCDFSSVSKLKLINSIIRESMRYNPGLLRGSMREVVHKNGLTMPNGMVLAPGTWVGLPVDPIHHDARFYVNPEEFDPSRFIDQDICRKTDKQTFTTASKAVDASDISETFLPFGYGRNSCPGRIFGVNVIKIALAHVAANYNMQPLPFRPANSRVGELNVPIFDTIIKVRRRLN